MISIKVKGKHLNIYFIQAEELILNQAHLVANNGKFPEEFENFLKAFSHFKFIIQVRYS